MKRIALALIGLALTASGTGCCCHHLYGNPLNPCGPTYGAAVVAPSATTAYYAPSATTAYAPSVTTAYGVPGTTAYYAPAVRVATVPVVPVY